MGTNSIFRRVIPSFRSRDTILSEIQYYHAENQERFNKLEKRLTDLDRKNEYLFYCLQHFENETDLETKKRIFLSLPRAGGCVADFQKVSNYILKRVKSVCDENDLQFALCGGTLLGAVRHHGFIPWDDDVDIDMLREDFEKLKFLLRDDNELVMQRYYRYMEKGTKPGYITKVKLRESDLFFVDIFPLELMSIEQGKEDAALKNKENLCEDFSKELREIFERHEFFYNGNDRPEAHPEMDDEVSALEKQYLEKYKLLFQINGDYTHFTRAIGNGKWLRNIYRIQPYDAYLPFERNAVEFEGERYDTFRNYDSLLKYQYGDYWSFPRTIVQQHESENYKYMDNDLKVLQKIDNLICLAE